MPAPTSPQPIVATFADLPGPVAVALADPPAPSRGVVAAGGIRFAVRTWGDPAAPPLLLLHGVTSSSGSWWRVGPALAASGRHVTAPDLPGHGETGGWSGRHRFAETAGELADLVRAAGLDRPGLGVVGHSWGAILAAHLPAAGIRPDRLVLLDPPALSVEELRPMTEDPVERAYDDAEAAIRAIGAAHPTWSHGDVLAKADALTRCDEAAARAVLLENGDWDGGLAALEHPAAVDVPTWIVRGERASGGFLPDARVPALAARVGPDRVLTIAGGPHSPHRTLPEATLVALLTALG